MRFIRREQPRYEIGEVDAMNIKLAKKLRGITKVTRLDEKAMKVGYEDKESILNHARNLAGQTGTVVKAPMGIPVAWPRDLSEEEVWKQLESLRLRKATKKRKLGKRTATPAS